MRVFLSHIHEEAPVAAVFKAWLEASFPSLLDVFVSSDIKDVPAGARWMQQIDSALSDCQAFLVLCSPRSTGRAWISFETGCAWIKRCPVIPICHSGVTKATLPMPLAEFQALDVDSPSFVGDLMSSIATHLAVQHTPRVDGVRMVSEISVAISGCAQSAVAPSKPGVQTLEFEQEQEGVLRRIAHLGDKGLSAEELAQHENTTQPRMQFYLDELVKRGLLGRGAALMGVPVHYRLTQEGRRFLISKNLL